MQGLDPALDFFQFLTTFEWPEHETGSGFNIRKLLMIGQSIKEIIQWISLYVILPEWVKDYRIDPCTPVEKTHVRTI